MSRLIGFVLTTMLIVSPLAAAEGPATGAGQAPPKNIKDQASYGFGVRIAQDLKSLNLNPDMLARGLIDGLNGKSVMTEPQIQNALRELEKMAQMRKAQQGSKNVEQGKAFLAANAKKPGVKTLPSGLQYKVLKSGNGPTPKASDRVRTHYHGTLIDGTVFDSSVQRGEPVEFPVGGVIRGWTEALQLMKVGDKWQLFLPPELAYGARGAGSKIGPNSTLIFEVELLGIVK